MNRDRRVVVTGIGTVNSLGTTVEEFWRAALAGRSGIRRITEFTIPDGFSQVAGVVTDDWATGEPLQASLNAGLDAPDRVLLLARAATLEAVRSAGFEPGSLAASVGGRVAVLVSSAIAQITRMEADFRRWSAEGKEPLRAPLAPRTSTHSPFFFNDTNARLAAMLGGVARHGAVTTGCTGGVDAVGAAAAMIRSGAVDVVVTGAAEAPITPLVVAAFGKINATSLRNADPCGASRPFDRDRDGFVLAEGAGILVLEAADHARRRGAMPLAEVAGFGSVNNCYHMTSMQDDGAPIAAASRKALAAAGVSPDEVDYVNLHGSSTPQNDAAEAAAMRLVFGARSAWVPVTSIKSMTGHSLAAANAIELVSVVRSIQEQVIPPTINLDTKDDACPLDVVAPTARRTAVSRVLKTSSGFSGIHSSLVVTSPERGLE